jgi:dipeptidyl aminopeptidase/acylaminoacyl peptidase
MNRARLFITALLAGGLLAGCPVKPRPAALDPTPVGDRDGDTADPVEPDLPPDPAPVGPAPGVTEIGNVVLDGTPAISDDLRDRLSQYLDIRSAGTADISADGKAMLIGTRFAETGQVHFVGQPMGARQQLTFGAEPASAASFVPGTTDKVLYASDEGGNEAQQFFLLDRETGTTTRITAGGKTVNRSYAWSRDGKLALMSNARNGKDFDVWLFEELAPGKGRMVVEGTGYFYPVSFSRDSKKLLVGEYKSINESHLYLVDLASGERTQIDDPSKISSNGGGPFAADGKSIFVASDRDGEFVQIYEVELATKTWRPITGDIKWDAESVALSKNGRTLAFTVNENGSSKLYLYDTRSRRRTAAKTPTGIISGLSFARDADVLAMTFASATGGTDAYTYDARRKRMTRWTRSEIGGLNPERFIEPELVKLKSFDGLEIPAFYYKPKGAGPFPVVVSIHGGPEGQARPYFSSTTQFLAAESQIAVLVPNVRGSAGYGKSYLKLDNGFKREDSVKDIGALLDWVKARPELDAGRTCVIGGSYGGYMVLASLVHFGERLACGIDVVGISSFVTFLENTADYRRDLRRAEYGDERDPKMRAHLEKISPLNHAGKIKSALFVAQGANDPRVPATEAAQIVKAVRASGHDVWYMLAKDEGHGFQKRSNRDIYAQLSIMFLEEHLKVSR